MAVEEGSPAAGQRGRDFQWVGPTSVPLGHPTKGQGLALKQQTLIFSPFQRLEAGDEARAGPALLRTAREADSTPPRPCS